MSDDERHLVGTRYKESGQDAAIMLGRELVGADLQAQRTRHWVEFAKKNPEGFLYCFRGGLRSRITQEWMEEAGVHYPYIKGGYKAMRQFLIKRTSESVARVPIVLISGRTGTGKTLLLNRIKRSLDLEGLANHRGSSFGPMSSPQPTPINFENNMAVRLLKLTEESEATIFVEGEGRQIGSLSVPEALRDKMFSAPTLVLEAEIETRIDIGIEDYVKDLLARIQGKFPGENGFEIFADRHRTSLFNIQKRLGSERFQHATAMLEAALSEHHNSGQLGHYRPFIRLLLEQYYDPMYDYQLSKRQAEVLCQGDQAALLRWLADNGVELEP
jgi:tRNA 2-selenouridine synthase